jgi:uncharacterized protein
MIEQNALNYGIVEAAIDGGHDDMAMRIAQPLLDRGDASTEWFIGRNMHLGARCSRDMSAALRLYDKAAASGFSHAVEAVRVINDRGLDWYADEEQESLEAIRNDMEHVPSPDWAALELVPRCSRQDRIRAFKWYCKAAEGIDPEMHIIVGLLHEEGICVRSSPRKALDWYLRAAHFGSEEAHLRFEALHRSLTGELHKDMRDVRDNERASFVVGRSIRRLGTPPTDGVAAFEWYLRAAEAGHADAQSLVAELYMGGVGTARNHVKGLVWLKLASERHPDMKRRKYLASWFALEVLRKGERVGRSIEAIARDWRPQPETSDGVGDEDTASDCMNL